MRDLIQKLEEASALKYGTDKQRGSWRSKVDKMNGDRVKMREVLAGLTDPQELYFYGMALESDNRHDVAGEAFAKLKELGYPMQIFPSPPEIKPSGRGPRVRTNYWRDPDMY